MLTLPDTTYNAVDFGIKGDGATDNTTNLQRMVDMVADRGGGTIYFPIGMYRVSKRNQPGQYYAVSLRNNLKFIGEGVGSIIRLASGQPAGTRIFSGYTVNNIQFENMCISGNGTNQTDANQQMHCVFLDACRNVSCSEVLFDGPQGDGILIRGNSDRVTIDQCEFFGCLRNGVTLGSGYNNVRIINNRFQETGVQSIDSEPQTMDLCANVLVMGNTIGRCKDQTNAYAITISGYSPTNPLRNYILSDNWIDGAIVISNAEGVVVHGNRILGSCWNNTYDRAAIGGSQYTRHVRITDNYVTNSSIQAVEVMYVGGNSATARPYNWTITGNTLEQLASGAANYGLRFGGCVDMIARTNTIIGMGAASGIRCAPTLAGSRNHVISDNIIKNFSRAVHFAPSVGGNLTDMLVTGNVFTDDQAVPSQTTGIWVEGGVAFITNLRAYGNVNSSTVTNPIVKPDAQVVNGI